MSDSTLRVVVEIDDAPESPELREAIRDRIERRLSYGVSWYDAATGDTHALNVDRVKLVAATGFTLDYRTDFATTDDSDDCGVCFEPMDGHTHEGVES